MANPNDAVGTNGAFGGRTSVNAFNDVLSAFSGRGILGGWACSPSSGLTVTLGGNGSDRDVAIAEDASGNKTTINNISQSPVPVTINPAPASNARIDAIVAYIEDSPNGSGITDNPDVVNMLVVSGTVASSPVAPNDSAIRSAITADGASGSTAYYAVLAYVTIPTGTTDVDSTLIQAGEPASIKIGDNAISAENIDFSTVQKSTMQSMGWGMSVLMVRSGNMVFLSGSAVSSQDIDNGQITMDETIPIGYRPTVSSGAIGGTVGGGSTGAILGWGVEPDGTMIKYGEGTSASPTRVNICGSWPTADPMPS